MSAIVMGDIPPPLTRLPPRTLSSRPIISPPVAAGVTTSGAEGCKGRRAVNLRPRAARLPGRRPWLLSQSWKEKRRIKRLPLVRGSEVVGIVSRPNLRSCACRAHPRGRTGCSQRPGGEAVLTKSLNALLPVLYLRGVTTGDFQLGVRRPSPSASPSPATGEQTGEQELDPDDDGPRVLPQAAINWELRNPRTGISGGASVPRVGVIAVQHGLFLEPRSGRTYGPHGSRALFLRLLLAKD